LAQDNSQSHGLFQSTGTVRNFTDLHVWQKSHQLFLDFVKDIQAMPNTRVTAILADQTARSVGSISANIAEGFASQNPREYCRYLVIARKSTSESENWFYKFRDTGLMAESVATGRIETCIEISKMLYSLIQAIRKPTTNKGPATRDKGL
jgi:four helix bundle protein